MVKLNRKTSTYYHGSNSISNIDITSAKLVRQPGSGVSSSLRVRLQSLGGGVADRDGLLDGHVGGLSTGVGKKDL